MPRIIEVIDHISHLELTVNTSPYLEKPSSKYPKALSKLYTFVESRASVFIHALDEPTQPLESYFDYDNLALLQRTMIGLRNNGLTNRDAIQITLEILIEKEPQLDVEDLLTIFGLLNTFYRDILPGGKGRLYRP